MVPVAQPNDNTRAVLAMILGMAAFVVSDVMVKLVGTRLPVGEVLFVRGIMSSAILFALILGFGQLRQLPFLWERWVGIRAAFEILGSVLYLFALFRLPIAHVATIQQSLPFIITVAVALLGETVGRRRWAAVAVGFVGVLIVMKPGFGGFSGFSLLALGSVLAVTIRDLATRMIPLGLPALLVTFSTTISNIVVGAGLGAFETWSAPTGSELIKLAAAAVFLSAGFYLVTVSVRTGSISVVAPYRYTFVVWALVAGIAVWGHRPSSSSLLGTVLIVGAGLYTLYREQLISRGGRSRKRPSSDGNIP